MDPRLLEVLVSPGDHTTLTLDGETPPSGAAISDGTLIAAGRSFAIREGVPRMVPEGGTEGGGDQSESQASFGAKWASLGADQREHLSGMQYSWFDQRYGLNGNGGIQAFVAGRERILDAGTGPGLHAARFAEHADGEVVGMDLSESVTRAQQSFGQAASNLNYVQGDILDPPFAPESFDLVVSDQVIHHTPDCPRAFRTLAGLLRPGGEIAVYVYRVKPLMRELADEHVRARTSAMSVEECREFSSQITELGRALSETGARIKLEKGVPLLGIEPGEHDVQRLIYWCFLKCYWNEELGEELSDLINFDWYHPVWASRHTEEEARGWAIDAGLEVTHVDVIESGISIRAVRPETSG
jgi:SAM-dependent methyltransferase/uncharacterized protein YbaR (Trm112 family)